LNTLTRKKLDAIFNSNTTHCTEESKEQSNLLPHRILVHDTKLTFHCAQKQASGGLATRTRPALHFSRFPCTPHTPETEARTTENPEMNTSRNPEKPTKPTGVSTLPKWVSRHLTLEPRQVLISAAKAERNRKRRQLSPLFNLREAMLNFLCLVQRLRAESKPVASGG